MTNKYPIHERIYQYVLMVLKFIKKSPKSYENSIIIGQLVRSVTSIGANDQEADDTSSKADFIHCYTIVRKECKETIFWIKLIGDLNPSIKDQIGELINEGEEIVRIISSIILNSRQKN